MRGHHAIVGTPHLHQWHQIFTPGNQAFKRQIRKALLKSTGNNTSMNLKKSKTERFLHALTFEVIAIAICAPLGAWLLGYSLAHMGILTLMISLLAMAWNMAFNALFDSAQRRWGFTRNLKARAVHAVLFEIGLIMAVVPLAAWWLDISLWAAFVLDIGIVLFFLPYTFVFNWAYDTLRARWVARQSTAPAKFKADPPEGSSQAASQHGR